MSSGMPADTAQQTVDIMLNSLRPRTTTAYAAKVARNFDTLKWPLQHEAETLLLLRANKACARSTCRSVLAAATRFQRFFTNTPLPRGPLVTAYCTGIKNTPRKELHTQMAVSRQQAPRQPANFDVKKVLAHLSSSRAAPAQRAAVMLVLCTLGHRRGDDILQLRASHLVPGSAFLTVLLPFATKNDPANCPRSKPIVLPNERLDWLGTNPALLVLKYAATHCPPSTPLLCRRFDSRPQQAISASTFGTQLRTACAAIGLPTDGVGSHSPKFVFPAAALRPDLQAMSFQSATSAATLEKYYADHSSAPKTLRILAYLRAGPLSELGPDVGLDVKRGN